MTVGNSAGGCFVKTFSFSGECRQRLTKTFFQFVVEGTGKNQLVSGYGKEGTQLLP